VDPITLILTALATGATAGSQTIANDVIKDAYAGLKTLIQRKFAGKSSAGLVLTEHETDPITWEAPLKKALIEMKVDQDEEVIKAAQGFMAQVDPKQAALGKYNVQVTGNIQGLNQGDYNTITQTFSMMPKDS
jgi:hypothetical protein